MLVEPLGLLVERVHEHRSHPDIARNRNRNRAKPIWFDIPIDGYWSDLTATFTVIVDGEYLAPELDDIHVHGTGLGARPAHRPRHWQ